MTASEFRVVAGPGVIEIYRDGSPWMRLPPDTGEELAGHLRVSARVVAGIARESSDPEPPASA